MSIAFAIPQDFQELIAFSQTVGSVHVNKHFRENFLFTKKHAMERVAKGCSSLCEGSRDCSHADTNVRREKTRQGETDAVLLKLSVN